MAKTQTIPRWYEESIMLGYLCGIDPKILSREFRFNTSDAKKLINLWPTYNYQENGLINFYRKNGNSEKQRLKNSLHMFLNYNYKLTPKGFHNFDSRQMRDEKVYRIIKENIYAPRIEKIALEISLDKFVYPLNNIRNVVSKILNFRYSNDFFNFLVYEKLVEEYSKKDFNLDRAFHEIKETLVNRIQKDGLMATPKKERFLGEIMEGFLNKREEYILRESFGIGCEKKKLGQISKEMGISSANAHIIKKKALSKLKHSPKSRRLNLLVGLITDSEIDQYTSLVDENSSELKIRILEAEHQNIPLEIKLQTVPIEELGLDERAYNGCKQAGMNSVKELMNQSEYGVLRFRNLGIKSLENIKISLARAGLELTGIY